MVLADHWALEGAELKLAADLCALIETDPENVLLKLIGVKNEKSQFLDCGMQYILFPSSHHLPSPF